MLDDDILILALKTCSPCLKSPFFIFRKSAKLSSTGLSLYGLSDPGLVGVPFWSAIAKEVCEST